MLETYGKHNISIFDLSTYTLGNIMSMTLHTSLKWIDLIHQYYITFYQHGAN